jgi:hypothetical protein
VGIKCQEETPEWLIKLFQDVGGLITPLGFIGELGFRYLSPADPANTTTRWLLAAYLIPHELAGGKHDGSSVVAGFSLSITELSKLFVEVSSVTWRVPRFYTDGLSGPEVWLEGAYEGEKADLMFVQLHIYSDPPHDETPAVVLNTHTNTITQK